MNQYKLFAEEWIEAWNSHNIENIMAHYDNEISFYSPVIIRLGVNVEGMINNKLDLQAYFQLALNNYPELHFKPFNILSGINSTVIYYESVNGWMSAEYMELNNQNKVTKVVAHYAL